MTAKSPGCLIVLLDQSSGMNVNWPDQPTARQADVLEALQESLARLASRGTGEYELAVLGYATDAANQPVVRSLLATGTPHLVRRSELKPAAPLGTVPRPEGQAPQKKAFETCLQLLEEWRSRAGNAPASPLILHLASGAGRPADGDPGAMIKRLQQWGGADGPPIVFQVQLQSQAGTTSVCLPASELGSAVGRWYSMRSSLLSPHLAALAGSPAIGWPTTAGSRALILEAGLPQWRQALALVELSLASWPKPSRIVWEYPPGEQAAPAAGPAPATPVPTAPTVDAQGAVFACRGHELVALDADGQGRWRLAAGDVFVGAPVLGPDGFLRAHSRDEMLYCVDADGHLQWRQPVGPPLTWAQPLVDPFGKTLVCVQRGGLAAIDPQGRMQEDYQAPRIRFDAPGLVHEGLLYLGGEDHCLHALELTPNGARDTWAGIRPVRGRTYGVIHSAVVLLPGPQFVVASRDDRLYSFGTDGSQRWCVNLEGRLPSSPTVNRRHQILICVHRSQGPSAGASLLACLDGNLGQPRWEHRLAAPVEAAPVVDDCDVVYVGDMAGTVHAVDPDGHGLWTEKLSAPIRAAGRPLPSERIVFGSEDGRIVLLRTR